MGNRQTKRSIKRGSANQTRGAAGPELTGVAVDAEQRSRLIECCAFFRAASHRPSRPGGYRTKDFQGAEADIDAIIAKHKPR